jgi:hypothetical protein
MHDKGTDIAENLIPEIMADIGNYYSSVIGTIGNIVAQSWLPVGALQRQ